MSVPALFRGRLTIPLLGAPMFLVSTPELVIAQCRAGIAGSFPALNARTSSLLNEWLSRVRCELSPKDAPFGVNLIVHKSNARFSDDLEIIVKHRVPLVITSVGAPVGVVERVHEYGGIVFHDIVNIRHANKAAAAGVDGLIAVCAGAGGHAGTLSPLALVPELRRFYAGTVILAGALTSGSSLRAAELIGADFGYMGTRFIATREANAPDDYKAQILGATTADIVYTAAYSGIPANYLRSSIAGNGLDPDDPQPLRSGEGIDIGDDSSQKLRPWRDIWSAGQGVGAIDDVPTVSQLVDRLRSQYLEACRRAVWAPQ